MTDVLISIAQDGGDMDIANGRTAMTDGLETYIALCLFGGNVDDAGTDATRESQWWGNYLEADSARHIRSRTQALIDSLPLSPANLMRIEDAARVDTHGLVAAKVASSVLVSASIPSRNSVLINVDVIGIDGSEYSYQFLHKRAALKA